jgi:hypothetical protein
MVDAVNILVLLNWPVSRDIGHANLLALVDERRACLEAKEESDEFGASFSMLWRVDGEAAYGAWLVVVLQVQRIPPVVVVHETLPFDGGLLQL